MSSARNRVSHSQNFLRRPELVDQLLDQSCITPDDLVVEIGPGRGIITASLARRCRQVLAVEKDPALGRTLQQRFAREPNVAVFAADFLDFPLPVTPFRVFANIPFNITTAIIAKLTSGISPPEDAWLVVQEEAAWRVMGTPTETLFAISLKPRFAPAIVHRFRASDFEPMPGVNTVLLHLQRRSHPLVADADFPRFLDFVSFVFSAWRPTARDALADLLPKPVLNRLVRDVSCDLHRAPSRIAFADWIALFAAFHDVADEKARKRAANGRHGLLLRQAELEKPTRTPTANAGRQGPLQAEARHSKDRVQESSPERHATGPRRGSGGRQG